MKKITSILLTLIVSQILFVACKKNSDPVTPTLTLAVSSNNFGTINSCTWIGNNQTNKGTPLNISFTISDPSGMMQRNTWQLFEQIATQPAVSAGSPTLSGNSFSKLGCITFGAFSSFPAKYYVVCNGTTSNTVTVTVNKPVGAF